jgi:hypothetical protein
MAQALLTGSNVPDHGFGRCDGHHEMVDFRLRKAPWADLVQIGPRRQRDEQDPIFCARWAATRPTLLEDALRGIPTAGIA